MPLRHGEARAGARTPEYAAYMAAKKRCAPYHPHAHRYAGRGIEFRFDSFEEFLAAVGRKPIAKMDLDRIDNDGHYEPGNVRWATHSDNCKNYTVTDELREIRRQNMRKALSVRWGKA